MRKTLFAMAAVAAAAAAGPRALADAVPLADGSVIQGEILAGRTTEAGLAVQLYDTGGLLVVDWDHVEPERRRELRLELGIDLPEETVIRVPGHVVLLTTGERLTGVVENRGGNPLRLRTRTGVRELDPGQVGGITDVQLEGVTVYSAEELFEMEAQRNPPRTTADRKALAQYAINCGAFDHARGLLEEARKDAEFMGTPEGRTVEAMLRQVDMLIRAKDAVDMGRQIKAAMYGRRWNDALALLEQMDERFQDQQIRDAAQFKLLETQVVKGREKHFRAQVQRQVLGTMEKLVESKARERKPLRPSEDQGRGAMTPGSLASAKQWMARELPNLLLDKVASDLGISREEVEKYWAERSDTRTRRESYGTGSFIVMKKNPLKRRDTDDRRRPPGAQRGGDRRAPGGQAEERKPLTEEEYWEAIKPTDRAKWMQAYFVENSGLFEIVRVDETELCSNCAGVGYTKSMSGDGQESLSVCPTCNTAGKVRKVVYR